MNNMDMIGNNMRMTNDINNQKNNINYMSLNNNMNMNNMNMNNINCNMKISNGNMNNMNNLNMNNNMNMINLNNRMNMLNLNNNMSINNGNMNNMNMNNINNNMRMTNGNMNNNVNKMSMNYMNNNMNISNGNMNNNMNMSNIYINNNNNNVNIGNANMNNNMRISNSNFDNNMNMNNTNNNMNMNNANLNNNMNNINYNMKISNENMNNNMNMNNMNNNMKLSNANMDNNNMNMNNMKMSNENKNNNINCNAPMKLIKNYSSNYEYSYVNAVLQAFSSLDCIRNWINELNDSRNQMLNIPSCITKELYILFSNLYSGNQPNSTFLISTFENQIRIIYKNNMEKGEYYILYYFLHLLHLENNCPINPNFDINSYKIQCIQNLKNEENMFNLFSNFFQQTTNSVISNYFYNIEKYLTSCPDCGTLFYYNHRNIITFELDKLLFLRNQNIPEKIGANIDLAECFYFYHKDYACQCPICQNPLSEQKISIISTPKVLIVYFKRLSHNLKCDVDFDIEFSVNNMAQSNNNSGIMNKTYYLKSIISLYQSNNSFKYFSDVNINGNWYRFCDNNFQTNIRNIYNYNELKKFEPQILIYELKDDNSNINPFCNSMNQNNNSLMMQISKKQMQFPQLKNLANTIQNNLALSNIKMEFIIQNNPNIQSINKINNNDNNNINSLFLNLEFYVIPENWDGKTEDLIIIKPQVTSNDTVEKSIENFYTKLVKPKKAIKRFEFNNQIVDTKSTIKLKDFGINNDSIIYAIKSDNFETL